MSKVEVGDAVKVLYDKSGHGFCKGEVVTVLQKHSEECFRCTNGLVGAFLSPEEFEIYKESDMEKSAEYIREEIIRIDTLIEKSKKDIEEAEKKRESLIEQLREKGFLLHEKDTVYHGNLDLSVEDIHAGDKLILTGWSHNGIISYDRVVVVRDNDKSEIPLFVRCVESGETDWVRLEDVKRA